jgi:transcriptional regulator with XRE-family HTH domain
VESSKIVPEKEQMNYNGMRKDEFMNTPDSTDNNALAQLLARARQTAGLSYGQIEKATSIAKTNLYKLEQGLVQTPNPTMLPALARVLNIPLADLYAAAGYEQPKTLPTFTPYLRSKYKGLPDEARAELAEAFERITNKYGYDPSGNGPSPGQDE